MYRSSLRFIITIAAFSVAWPIRPAHAEEARGRLPDGRAFRTDGEGNQLVDYIAELEVQTEALERRIYGLEEELATKQRVIDRLGQGAVGNAALDGRLVERTLTGGSPPAPRLAPTENETAQSARASAPDFDARCRADIERLTAELNAAHEEKTALRTAADVTANEVAGLRSENISLRSAREAAIREVTAARAESTTLRDAATEARRNAPLANAAADMEKRLRTDGADRLAASTNEQAAPRPAPAPDCSAAVALARREAAEGEATVRAQLASLRDEQARAAEAARSHQDAAVSDTQTQIVKLESDLARAQDEIVALRASRDEIESKLAATTAALDRTTAATATTTQAAAVALPTESRSVAVVRQPVSREVARSRLAVVESLRGSMLSELNQVRGLVATRDARFAAAQGSENRQVRFSPSRLVSTNRRTLDDVASAIRAAQQVHELTALRTDLAEIRALAQGDIDLLRRTGRSSAG